jgi:predicted transcriptional regulator
MINPKPRGNMEIKKEILNALKEGEMVPTRIQNELCVSYTIMSRYLFSLENNGFIKKLKVDSSDSKRVHYSLTEKGEDYLKMLEDMDEVIRWTS